MKQFSPERVRDIRVASVDNGGISLQGGYCAFVKVINISETHSYQDFFTFLS